MLSDGLSSLLPAMRNHQSLRAQSLRYQVALELMLEDASIKLSSVASSLKTVSARAILTAMINGESYPLRLADMAKGGCGARFPIWPRR